MSVPIHKIDHLPWWRRPIPLLFLMAAGMPIAFSTWSALLNNFVIEVADFDGADIGLLHTIREIPGFLAVAVIYLLIFMREQTLAWVSLLLLGLATAVTAYLPQMAGIMTITLLSSIGFHYYETINQSLQLQWIDKAKAPEMLGWMMGVASATTLVAYVAIVLCWDMFNLTYSFVYMASGCTTAGIARFCWLAFPRFESPTVQRKEMVLRKRYWLYY
ncbi:MAG: MFS transporter, partial [Pseudomonadota bacterium]